MTVGGAESMVEERELGCVGFSRTVCRQQTEIVGQPGNHCSSGDVVECDSRGIPWARMTRNAYSHRTVYISMTENESCMEGNSRKDG